MRLNKIWMSCGSNNRWCILTTGRHFFVSENILLVEWNQWHWWFNHNISLNKILKHEFHSTRRGAPALKREHLWLFFPTKFLLDELNTLTTSPWETLIFTWVDKSNISHDLSAENYGSVKNQAWLVTLNMFFWSCLIIEMVFVERKKNS